MDSSLLATLFPTIPRRAPYGRAINIALRTAHLMTSGILLGGHAFDIPSHRLISLLYLTLASGAGLMLLELYRSCRWLYLVEGVMVVLKLLVLILAGLWWEQRVWLLLLVVVLGSVGSHMPSRLRHYSIVHGRVISERSEADVGAATSLWRP